MAFFSIFRLARLLLALPFPCLRGSYRFHPRGASVYRASRRAIVGGRYRDLVSRPSVSFYPSRSSVRSIFPYRLVGGMRVPFLSARSTASSVGGGSVSFSLTRYARPFVSSLFSSPRLVWRLVSILCGSPVVSSGSSIRRRLVASSRPAVRFPVLFIVLRCFALLGSSFSSRLPVSSVASRQAINILSFRMASRSSARVFSVPPCLVLSCSRPSISLVASHGHGNWRRLVLPLSRCGVFFSRCPVVGSDCAMTGTGWACRSTIRGTRRFIQLVFPIGVMTGRYGIEPQGRRTQCVDMGQYEGNGEGGNDGTIRAD